MIKVGLTGGIGSGKSLIAKVFGRLGVPVYDSDLATKQLYLTNPELKKQLIENFGPKTYFKNGQLDRKYLGEVIFGDKSKLELINRIVHPIVKLDFKKWIYKNNQKSYIIKESAILIESGAYKQVDKIIVVNSPLELRLERVIARDKTNRNEVLRRINSQLPEAELLTYADYIVKNDNEHPLLPQIINIHNQLQKQRL